MGVTFENPLVLHFPFPAGSDVSSRDRKISGKSGHGRRRSALDVAKPEAKLIEFACCHRRPAQDHSTMGCGE